MIAYLHWLILLRVPLRNETILYTASTYRTILIVPKTTHGYLFFQKTILSLSIQNQTALKDGHVTSMQNKLLLHITTVGLSASAIVRPWQ